MVLLWACYEELEKMSKNLKALQQNNYMQTDDVIRLLGEGNETLSKVYLTAAKIHTDTGFLAQGVRG
jgi:hypothetical protein